MRCEIEIPVLYRNILPCFRVCNAEYIFIQQRKLQKKVPYILHRKYLQHKHNFSFSFLSCEPTRYFLDLRPLFRGSVLFALTSLSNYIHRGVVSHFCFCAQFTSHERSAAPDLTISQTFLFSRPQALRKMVKPVVRFLSLLPFLLFVF